MSLLDNWNWNIADYKFDTFPLVIRVGRLQTDIFFSVSEQFQSSFRAVSEQFQCSHRMNSERFWSSLRVVSFSVRLASSFRAVSVEFQWSFSGVSVEFQWSFRAVRDSQTDGTIAHKMAVAVVFVFSYFLSFSRLVFDPGRTYIARPIIDWLTEGKKFPLGGAFLFVCVLCVWGNLGSRNDWRPPPTSSHLPHLPVKQSL